MSTQQLQTTKLRIFSERDHRGNHVVERLDINANGKKFITQYTLAPPQLRELLRRVESGVSVEYVATSRGKVVAAGMNEAGHPWRTQFDGTQNATHPEFSANAPSQRESYQNTHNLKYGASSDAQHAPSVAAAGSGMPWGAVGHDNGVIVGAAAPGGNTVPPGKAMSPGSAEAVGGGSTLLGYDAQESCYSSYTAEQGREPKGLQQKQCTPNSRSTADASC